MNSRYFKYSLVTLLVSFLFKNGDGYGPWDSKCVLDIEPNENYEDGWRGDVLMMLNGTYMESEDGTIYNHYSDSFFYEKDTLLLHQIDTTEAIQPAVPGEKTPVWFNIKLVVEVGRQADGCPVWWATLAAFIMEEDVRAWCYYTLDQSKAFFTPECFPEATITEPRHEIQVKITSTFQCDTKVCFTFVLCGCRECEFPGYLVIGEKHRFDVAWEQNRKTPIHP